MGFERQAYFLALPLTYCVTLGLTAFLFASKNGDNTCICVLELPFPIELSMMMKMVYSFAINTVATSLM